MKTSRLRLLSIPLVALAIACHDSGDVTAPPETIPPGAVAYTGYDEHGLPVVQGWVKLDIAIIAVGPSSPVNVTGTWELRRVGSGGDGRPAGIRRILSLGFQALIN